MTCRTLAEIEAAARRDQARNGRPLSQEQVNYAWALIAPHIEEAHAAREAA